MMATYKNGHFSCEYHGDLGEHDTAIEEQTVLYGGDGGGLDGFICMACLGDEVASLPPEPRPTRRAMMSRT